MESGLKAVLYSCPRLETPPQYFPMSQHDASALKGQTPITLAYRFRQFIEPQRLSQSLFLLLEQYPAFAGCLVCLGDVLHVKTGAHDAEVQAIEVPREALSSSQRWLSIAEQFPLRPTGSAGARFYQVLLLHTADPLDGCVVLVTFDHGLADAATCGYLMATWSTLHTAMPPDPDVTENSAPAPSLHPTPQPGDFEIECEDPSLRVRRLHFSPTQLASLRDSIGEQSDSRVTTNDILMAICVCAVARYADRTAEDATVSMMVDARGRGLPLELLGNGARAVNLPIAWAVALSRDLAAVAVALRRGLDDALKGLPARCAAAKLATTEVLGPDPVSGGAEAKVIAEGPHDNAVAPEPGPPAASLPSGPLEGDDFSAAGTGSTALFYFNSWARLRSLVDADFGAGLTHVEWVPLRTIQRRRSFIVVPSTPDGGLALQACLPAVEMDYFCQLWDTFTAAPSA